MFDFNYYRADIYWSSPEEPFETKGALEFAPDDLVGIIGQVMTCLSRREDVCIKWQVSEVNDYSAE